MSEPILPFYTAFITSANELAASQKKHEANAKALLASLPEGVLFSPVENPPMLIKRVGDQIVAETPPYLGLPYEVKV